MAKKRKNGHAVVRVRMNYRHTGQDPMIKIMKEVRDDSDLPEKEINKRHSLSNSTSRNWFNGKTRNPQHTTMAEYLGAFGKRFVIEDSNSTTPILRKRR